MEILDTVQANDRATKYVDSFHGDFLEERVLGIDWCIESYILQFRITMKVRPLTRRENLATVSSVYDLLGSIAPIVLVGKQLLHQMYIDKTDWDDPFVDNTLRSFIHLESMKIRRCFKLDDFRKVK